MTKPYENFDISKYHWRNDVDYRKHPELYKVGKGEQGVFICEPYKSEIVKNWHLRTPDVAQESSEQIYQQFLAYLENNDFVGADMARKFLQMGFTRARRYANYKGGKKYNKQTDASLKKGTGDPLKIKSAGIFYHVWQKAEKHSQYKVMKKQWKEQYG